MIKIDASHPHYAEIYELYFGRQPENIAPKLETVDEPPWGWLAWREIAEDNARALDDEPPVDEYAERLDYWRENWPLLDDEEWAHVLASSAGTLDEHAIPAVWRERVGIVLA